MIPKLPVRGFGWINKMDWNIYPENTNDFHQRPQESEKHFLSKYREILVEKLKSSSSMSESWCITDMKRVMVKEGYKLMKQSVNEENLFIINDDLVLMTVK